MKFERGGGFRGEGTVRPDEADGGLGVGAVEADEDGAFFAGGDGGAGGAGVVLGLAVDGGGGESGGDGVDAGGEIGESDGAVGVGDAGGVKGRRRIRGNLWRVGPG